MSIVTNLFLAFCALLSLLFAGFNPIRHWRKLVRSTDVQAHATYRQTNVLGLTNGCTWSLLTWIEVLVVFLVEPSCVVWALVEQLHPPVLTYGALCIIVFRASLLYTVFTDTRPQRVESSIWMSRFWVVVWVLPALYFWYFFSVRIGLLR